MANDSTTSDNRHEVQGVAAFLLAVLLFTFLHVGKAAAQDLEPRRWTHLPVGLNVFGVTTGWSGGDILFDPVLLIEDARFNMAVAGMGYTRAFEIAGKTARVDFKAPYVSGRWKGLVNGEFDSINRHGFADPMVRFSINLYGAPALSGKAFVAYKQQHPINTTIGAAVSVVMPVGEYNSKWLINLGSNRWIVHPQIGVLHQRRQWQFELTGSVFIHETNNEFFRGGVWEQDPLWFVQAHIIRSFKPGWWASLSGGFAYGGQSTVNGQVKQDDQRSSYMALSLGMPLGRRQSLKLTYLRTNTNITVGKKMNGLLLGWSVNWGH